MALTTPTLTTSRLVLRPVEESDRDAILAIQSDRDALRYWDEPAWSDPGRFDTFLERSRRMADENRGVRVALVRRDDGVTVGWASLGNWNSDFRSISVGYSLARSAWGQGLATEATRALVGWAFDALPVNRIQAEVDTRNTASRRVLEKAGFTLEGTLRQDCIVEGVVSDSWVFGMLRSDPRPIPDSGVAPRPGAGTSDDPAPVVWWINGPFGVGKTTAVRGLADQVPGLRIFDPEEVGFLLRRSITEPVDDFQSWPAWRALTAATATELVRHDGRTVVCPMSLLTREWASDIFARLDAAGIAQRHVVLHADCDELTRRIRRDSVETGAAEWRLAAVERYEAALPWLRASADVVDTTHLSPAEVVAELRARLLATKK